MEQKRVVISTVYSGKAVKVAINKLSPDKIILIVDEPMDKTKEEAVNELKKVFKDIITIETLKTPVYETSVIAQKVTRKIDEEFKKGNEILLHITEGRKITSLALLFSGYLRKEKIRGAYYITEETNQVLTLPILNLSLGETKKHILMEIGSGNGKVKNLMKELEIQQSAVYQHIHELKDEGYISNDKKPELTDLGRIMIL